MTPKYNPNLPSKSFDMADYNVLVQSNKLAPLVDPIALRFDSAEEASAFFARELDYIKTKTYDVLYPEFHALQLFPLSNEVNPGAESITYYSYDKAGMAQIIANYADDLPRVDVFGVPKTGFIKSIGDAFGYSIQDMRASRLAGKSLDTRRGESAKYFIDAALNRIAWAGDEEHGLQGILSTTNDVPLFTLPTNSGGTSTAWKDKTPEEVLADIKDMLAYVHTTTKGVERPDTLLLPTEAYAYIAWTPREHSDMSILSWIKGNVSQIKDIIEVTELNGDTGITPYPGQDIALLYTRNASKVTIEIPMPFMQHPVQPKNLAFEVQCEARTGGAIIYYPLSMMIIPGI